MTTKKTYRRPNTTVVLLAAESSLMTISAATSDPTEGEVVITQHQIHLQAHLPRCSGLQENN